MTVSPPVPGRSAQPWPPRRHRLARPVAVALGAAALVVALTWLLEHAVPPPYSGYLALCVVGIAVTELLRRQPRQRALRLLRVYFRARERGGDEPAARARLLARLQAGDRAAVEAAWVGASEKQRVLGALGALVGRQGLGAEALAGLYDRVRDQFVVPGWEALPPEFVAELRRRLDEGQQAQLEALADRYQLFRQRFFRAPSALGADPARGVAEFSRLLQSLGHRVAGEFPGDAERAYRLALALRPAGNLAHAGLALLLERTGRLREARREAELALGVLDEYARLAATREPVAEDIGPFRSPRDLRAALERLAAGGGPGA